MPAWQEILPLNYRERLAAASTEAEVREALNLALEHLARYLRLIEHLGYGASRLRHWARARTPDPAPSEAVILQPGSRFARQGAFMSEEDIERAVLAALASGRRTLEAVVEFVEEWMAPMVHVGAPSGGPSDDKAASISARLTVVKPSGRIH